VGQPRPVAAAVGVAELADEAGVGVLLGVAVTVGVAVLVIAGAVCVTVGVVTTTEGVTV
jgi:hypothetical protein